MHCTRLAANTGRKKSPSGHHGTTSSGHIFPTKACIDNWKKKLVNLLSSNTSSTCPDNMVNVGPLTAEIGSAVDSAKTRNPLKFAGVPQTRQQISAVSGRKPTISQGHVGKILLFNEFFPIVDMRLKKLRQSCPMVRRWRFFASCISSKPRAAHFRHAF